MISLAGNFLLIIALISFAAIVSLNSFITAKTVFLKCNKSSETRFDLTSTNEFFFLLSNLIIVFSFLLLIYAFITSDFSVRNVFLNGSTITPLIYKIAGSWASHEGSMLLYITLLCTISTIYIKISNYQRPVKNLQINILAFIQILFLCFIYFTSNPFESFKFSPNQGLGLNPTLQDKALSIHPPLLYMGYVGFVTTYVNAILLLLKPDSKEIILQNNLRFTAFSLMMLTLGIGLGAWWAYRELGWGGYWFFDPVENISLMPWLIGIALFHFLVISTKRKLFFKWSIFCSFLVFLLTIYGIFFVRSGIISSVHSFAYSAERGLWLFVICTILTFFACFAWFIGSKNFVQKESKTVKNYNLSLGYFKNIKFILSGNILWLTAFGLLFVALIYPVYYYYFFDIDLAIDPKYFHKTFIPIFIPIIIFASISPYANKITLKDIFCVIFALLITLLIYYYCQNMGFISGSIILASVFLMSQMLLVFLFKAKFQINLSLLLGHFALGMLAFTITTNTLFSKELEFIGKTGDTVSKGAFTIKLNDIKFSDSEVYYRQIVEFSVIDQNRNITILRPENRLYKIENTISQESDIYSFLTHDIYAVLNKIEDNNVHAIIYYRPMIYFIWLSVFLIALSFCIYIVTIRSSKIA